jgi:hypothetical protein
MDRDPEKIEVVALKEFSIDFSFILIGLYYNNSFIKYYYTSSQTLLQHQFELKHPFADFDQNSFLTNISINQGKLNNLTNTGLYFIYCGGLDNNNLRKIVVNDNVSCVNTSATKTVFYQDYNEQGIINNRRVEKENLQYETGSYECFRVLVDIFGNYIVQKSLSGISLNPNKYAWCEQQLYNTRFSKLP